MSKKIVTHDGPFHADDVFSVAALMLTPEYADASIVRSRDPDVVGNADLALDVGRVYDPARLRFDHHQEAGAGTHENGVPYASFGLIWKHFGKSLVADDVAWRVVEKKLVQSIDADDCGYSENEKAAFERYSMDTAVKAFYPVWDEPEEFNQRFLEALSFAGGVLKRAIAQANAEARAYKEANEAYAASPDKRMLVSEKRYTLGTFAEDHPELLLLIRPYSNGNWSATCVEQTPGSFTHRMLFPEAWRGKENEELQSVTGVQDAVFCHRTGFAAFAKSKQGAVLLGTLALSTSS